MTTTTEINLFSPNPALRRQAREAALREMPALQRQRAAVQQVWGAAMNAMESGWEPPNPEAWVPAVQELGRYLSDTAALEDRMIPALRAAAAQAVRDGRLRPEDIREQTGLSGWPVVLIVAVVAAALVGYLATTFWRDWLEYKRRGRAMTEVMTLVAQGMHVPREIMDLATGGTRQGGGVGSLGPWIFGGLALVGALALQPWRWRGWG